MSVPEGDVVDTLIIGAGPIGMGAAKRLLYHGKTSWLLVDALPVPGSPQAQHRANAEPPNMAKLISLNGANTFSSTTILYHFPSHINLRRKSWMAGPNDLIDLRRRRRTHGCDTRGFLL